MPPSVDALPIPAVDAAESSATRTYGVPKDQGANGSGKRKDSFQDVAAAADDVDNTTEAEDTASMSMGPPSSAGIRKPGKPPPSRSDWERHKDKIKDLYLQQGKTLKEVQAILKDIYGFRAT
jgi:hypothetical protein